MTTKYEYAPLSTSPQEFRIVHLLPGNFHDTIQCELITASLDAPPPYKTLSYVWGDPTITRMIKLHGTDFEATDSLFRALRRYRLKVGVFVMWIDALCINQLDIGERGRQVGVMGKIYERCEEVWVWLGEDFVHGGVEDDGIQLLTLEEVEFNHVQLGALSKEKPRSPGRSIVSGNDESSTACLRDPTTDTRTIVETSKLPWFKTGDDGKEVLDWNFLNEPNFGANHILAALAVMTMLKSGRHLHELPCFHHCPGEQREYIYTSQYELAESGFHALLNFPYWERIWVIQELALPPVAYMVYGSHKLDWEYFSSVQWLIQEHMAPCCCSNGILAIRDTETIPRVIFTFLSSCMEPMEELRNERQAGRILDMTRALRHTFPYRATNPLDKIYGVFGMIARPKIDSSLLPDYEIDLQELCRRVTLASIDLSGTLDSLMGSRMFHNKEFSSWILDWTRGRQLFDDDMDRWLYHIHKEQSFSSIRFSASLDLKPEVELIRNSHLLLNGTYLDRTIILFDPIAFGKGLNDTTCDTILAQTQDIIFQDQDYIAGGSWEDAIWRTICGDVLYDYDTRETRRSTAMDKMLYNRLYGVYPDGASTSEKDLLDVRSSEYDAGIQIAAWGRRLFITELGYLGLGPETMEIGDEIFVCNGSTMPFVLRKMDIPNVKAKDEDDVEFPVYVLVGECYTHGVMDGEVIKREVREVLRLALR